MEPEYASGQIFMIGCELCLKCRETKRREQLFNRRVEEIGLAQATISQHLKELKSIGLLNGEVEGKSMCYCINVERWTDIQKKLNTFFNKFGEG